MKRQRRVRRPPQAAKPKKNLYRINEVFYSIQGEGVRQGTAATFVRFSGCNVNCTKAIQGFDCDTNHSGYSPLDAYQTLMKAKAAVPKDGPRWVIFTGGEPLLQLDAVMLRAFRMAKFRVAVETNGTIKVKGDMAPFINWLTVSPKTEDIKVHQREANELKYVLSAGDPLPKTNIRAQHKLISPAFDGAEMNEENVKWCVKLVKENPEWQLTIQMHKLLGVR